MNQKQNSSVGASSPPDGPVFPIWKVERQIAEQLHRGVKTIDGSVVAVSVGSSMFTYVRHRDNVLVVKYIDGCIAVTASAEVAGEEVKVYNVSVHNICSAVDL